MRWTEQKPEIGSTRTCRKFLWLPLRIGKETRWLETAAWSEICRKYQLRGHKASYRWERVEFLDLTPRI